MISDRKMELESFAKAFRSACDRRGINLKDPTAFRSVIRNLMNGDFDYFYDESQDDTLIEISRAADSDKSFSIRVNLASPKLKGQGRDDLESDEEVELISHAVGHAIIHMGLYTDESRWGRYVDQTPFRDSHIHRFNYFQSEAEAQFFAERILS